jgi:GntR family transcriptional regulator
MPSPEAIPIYSRIEARLRLDIEGGRFKAGDRMPSEAELAREFNTTRGTVRQALQRLVYDGLIVRKVGQGTFAGEPRFQSRIDTRFITSFEGQMAAMGAKVTLQLLSFELRPAPDDVSQGLRLLPGTPAFRLMRRRLIERDVVGYEDRWLRMDIGRRVKSATLESQSAIALVEEALGEQLGDLEVFVRATAADAKSARLLDTKRGLPLLIRSHTFFDRRQIPVLVGQSVFRGDRYQFSYRWTPRRRVP